MGSVAILVWRTRLKLAAVEPDRLFRLTRLARLGAPPPVEADGDALEQVHGHPSPSHGRQSPPALRLEAQAKVRAHRRRRLGIARVPAENAAGLGRRLGRNPSGRRDVQSSQDGVVRLDKAARRDGATTPAAMRTAVGPGGTARCQASPVLPDSSCRSRVCTI